MTATSVEEIASPKFPGVHVALTGEDGNVFSIIARVLRALRLSGEAEAKDLVDFRLEIQSAANYDAALQVVMRWVSVS